VTWLPPLPLLPPVPVVKPLSDEHAPIPRDRQNSPVAMAVVKLTVFIGILPVCGYTSRNLVC
jgi:hypothetical protein